MTDASTARAFVAKAFGASARSYDEFACVQLAAARTLVSMIEHQLSARATCAEAKKWAIDLGSGTVPMARPLAQLSADYRWLAIDVAPQMLMEARERGRLDEHEGVCWQPLCADASALPLANNSVSLIYSSFALQWSQSLSATLAELQRVLLPGGCAHIAVPVAGSLHEFSSSWRQVDDGVHINALASRHDWCAAICDSGLVAESEQLTTITEHYADVRAIGRMLKATGAHHVHRDTPTGLMTPSRYAALVSAYETLRETSGLPLSWNILFLSLSRPA